MNFFLVFTNLCHALDSSKLFRYVPRWRGHISVLPLCDWLVQLVLIVNITMWQLCSCCKEITKEKWFQPLKNTNQNRKSITYNLFILPTVTFLGFNTTLVFNTRFTGLDSMPILTEIYLFDGLFFCQHFSKYHFKCTVY